MSIFAWLVDIRWTHFNIRIFFCCFLIMILIIKSSFLRNGKRAVMIIVARRGGHMPQPQKSVHMNGLLLCFLHVLVHKIWLNATGFALCSKFMCGARQSVYWLISCCFGKIPYRFIFFLPINYALIMGSLFRLIIIWMGKFLLYSG